MEVEDLITLLGIMADTINSFIVRQLKNICISYWVGNFILMGMVEKVVDRLLQEAFALEVILMLAWVALVFAVEGLLKPWAAWTKAAFAINTSVVVMVE